MSRTTASRRRHTPHSAEELRHNARIFLSATLKDAAQATQAMQAPPDRLGMSADEMHATRDAALLGVRDATATSMLHAEAAEHALLSQADEQRLARQMRSIDTAEALAARDALVSANVRLVGEIARHYVSRRGAGLDLDDVMQEGLIGLVRAAESFDPNRGTRFSTHAVWWIRQAISRAIVDKSAAIRIPAYLAQRRSTLRRLRDRLEAQTGQTPDDATLAEQTGWALDLVREALALQRETLSLDSAIIANGTHIHSTRAGGGVAGDRLDALTLADLLSDPDADDAFAASEQRADAATPAPDSVLVLIQTLATRPRRRGERDVRREMTVVVRRVVLGHTLTRIAGDLHLSRERVRQLEERGMALIRQERARVRRQMKSQMRQGGVA
jgi:RNA polymerase sigma factor (sigma-70 family)